MCKQWMRTWKYAKEKISEQSTHIRKINANRAWMTLRSRFACNKNHTANNKFIENGICGRPFVSHFILVLCNSKFVTFFAYLKRVCVVFCHSDKTFLPFYTAFLPLSMRFLPLFIRFPLFFPGFFTFSNFLPFDGSRINGSGYLCLFGFVRIWWFWKHLWAVDVNREILLSL